MNSAQNVPKTDGQNISPVTPSAPVDESMGITGAVAVSSSQSPSVAPQATDIGIPLHQSSITDELSISTPTQPAPPPSTPVNPTPTPPPAPPTPPPVAEPVWPVVEPKPVGEPVVPVVEPTPPVEPVSTMAGSSSSDSSVPPSSPPGAPPSGGSAPPPDDSSPVSSPNIAVTAPPPPPADTPPVISFQKAHESKFPHMFVTILVAVVMLGFSGSFLFYQLNHSKVKVVTKPVITPPVSLAPSPSVTPIENAFTSPSTDENPFATPSATVQNPFGIAQNPFDQLSSSSAGSTPYTNPFAQ